MEVMTMILIPAEVVKCKKLSVRAHPDEIENSLDIVEKLSAGDRVMMYPNESVYDWKGRMHCKIRTLNYNDGYVASDALKIIGGTKRGQG
jgi:hypothetical protein